MCYDFGIRVTRYDMESTHCLLPVLEHTNKNDYVRHVSVVGDVHILKIERSSIFKE